MYSLRGSSRLLASKLRPSASIIRHHSNLPSLSLNHRLAPLIHTQQHNRYLASAAVTRPSPPSSPSSPPPSSIDPLGRTIPPNFSAKIGHLQTFTLPETVSGTESDITLGKNLISAWRADGILQISMDPSQEKVADKAFAASNSFFGLDPATKARCVDDQSFAGYIGSGEEITAGIADYSEIFTVTKDLPLSDERVKSGWPCHGPCPWPTAVDFRDPMKEYMTSLGTSGEKLLQLIACGLGLNMDALTSMTDDGWHHLRVLRFPPLNGVNGKGKDGRGIGSHTDYGLLVIAAQDHVGGLFIRPPYQDELYSNWSESTAGKYEDDEKWVYVPPVKGVFTVFPGDMMQYMTSSYLPSTPHKVGLNTSERFAFAYFHEPNFRTVVKPFPALALSGGGGDHQTASSSSTSSGAHPTPPPPPSSEDAIVNHGIHYGSHFTNMFMRNYPDRITAARMHREKRLDMFKKPELRM